ncbi:MAG: molybdenum cofactor biosynthesis protein MoaE [Pseudomonadota bacterium]
MSAVCIAATPIDGQALTQALRDPYCGGFVSFEGWVRNHNEGERVLRLEYEVYTPIAVSEGEKIIAEAKQRFAIDGARCVHREGMLALGDMAVWVGVTAAHRGPAFDACQYIIDNVKTRLPIWKKESYENGDSGWVNCEQPAAHGHAHG